MSCSTEVAGDWDPSSGTLLGGWNVSKSWCNSHIFWSKSFRITSLERWSSTTEVVKRFKDSRISACLCEARMLWKFSRWANKELSCWSSSWECRINEDDWSAPERPLDVPRSKWRYCIVLKRDNGIPGIPCWKYCALFLEQKRKGFGFSFYAAALFWAV